MIVKQNIERLKYLLSLYNLTEEEFLLLISEGLKKPLTNEVIFCSEIKVDYLKRVDKVFNKGLNFHLDPKNIEKSKDSSIFFRKSKFGVNLNLSTRKIVNYFEEYKISLSAIAKLSDIKLERQLPVYTIDNNPKIVAKVIRNQINYNFKSNEKEYLTELINILAKKNILVFEFVETWNKKEKTNIDGFFLQPNVIVLKRQQTSFKREIFTLAHELGHYLLDEEEIEQMDVSNLNNKNLSKIENWCNDFAYYFLVGNYDDEIDNITIANDKNDYVDNLIIKISKNTNISKIALYTRLLKLNKISRSDYSLIFLSYESKRKAKVEEEKKKRELDKLNGVKKGGAIPIPIKSPLLISTIKTAFYEGVINEYEFCKKLNIKPENFSNYI